MWLDYKSILLYDGHYGALKKDCRSLWTSAVCISYTSILTGFSRNPASACTFGWAASAPSLIRWSTEMVAFMHRLFH